MWRVMTSSRVRASRDEHAARLLLWLLLAMLAILVLWPIAAMLDGLATGIGFTFGVTSVGAVREILGSGTLFSGASILLGPHFSFLEMHLLPGYRGFLLMLLPPGGFVVMGLLLALGRLRRVVLARLFKPTRVVPAATATATAGGCHV